MKKIISLFLATAMLLSAAGCGSDSGEQGEESTSLTIYTTVADSTVETLVPQFEEQTGITVELVTGGVGELLKRIESEKDNPQGDLIWGAALSSIQSYDSALFESYVSENNDQIMEEYQMTDSPYTVYGVALRCLLVNQNLTSGITIDGYESLLQDALKGQIAMVDPSASSSGFGQLSNMLYDMGTDNDPESDAAWQYVTDFCTALDGKLLNSSSEVWKGVCDGEYAVGLTYEEVSLRAVKDGYPVQIVYCKEGAFGEATTAAIIKGGANTENAKKFIDFLTSYDVQTTLSTDLCLRGVRTDLEFSSTFVDLSEIKMADADPSYASAHKQEWLDKFMEIWTSVAQ